MPLSIGFVVYPGLSQLALTGPLQVFAGLPDTTCHIAAKTLAPVASDSVLSIPPTRAFADCPDLDLICVPGGLGASEALRDSETMTFIRERGRSAKWVTSVCTGAFLIGAAGFLKNRRAATHWAYRDLLPLVGATAGGARVMHDGNVWTCAGVTAGIDFALAIAAEIASPGAAQSIQLAMEYDPAPPFDAGSAKFAPEPVKQRLDVAYNRMRHAMRDALASA
ncbi:MAG: DJ-1/PfpI family protein [Alphaproteobacteria bacterium]|nr:DJ-1/PfpI family protein [Alphaproteobacteria bacterium]